MLSNSLERFRTSFFFVPLVYVVGGVVLGILGPLFDDRLDLDGASLPLGVTSTVGSARAVLTTVASATMTVAGIAFSISLLILQLASTQYSPRIVHGLFRDPFNKQVMGVVLGTFTYCLVVLRTVHDATEPGASAVVPTISVSVGVVLGVVAVIAIVAFIDHNAHATDVSNLLSATTGQALDQVRGTWAEADGSEVVGEQQDAELVVPLPGVPAVVITASDDGWIQQLSPEQVLGELPPATTLRWDHAVGDFAISGAPLGLLWPAPDHPDDVIDRIRDVVVVGRSRTIQHDPAYGLRQLADVALRSLSTGVNDPTTAQDAILHLTAVLHEMFRRRPPLRVERGQDGRRLVVPQAPGHVELIRLAFEEIRRAAAAHPRVCVDLLDALARLRDAAPDGSASAELVRQARLVVDGSARGGHLDEDERLVRQAYLEGFATSPTPVGS